MRGQDVLMSSGDTTGSPDWETPQPFFDLLNDYFGPFTLDAAATAKTTKCDHYYSSLHNALIQCWPGTVFCNPPYGAGLADWINHGWKQSLKHNRRVVMLLPARTDIAVYHDIVLPRATCILFVRGRIKFKLPGKKNSATFPSMVVVFDSEAKKITGLPYFGTVVQPKTRNGKVVECGRIRVTYRALHYANV